MSMARLPSFRRSSFWGLLLAGAALAALEIPAGTEVEIRLKTKLSTAAAKPQDPVEAVVLSPVMTGGQFVIPAGAVVRGTVEKVTRAADGQRAALLLSFRTLEFDGESRKIEARVSAVDNAREKVDEQGQITGILASETITGQLDAGINKVAEKYAGFAELLNAAKSAILKSADSEITYESGVEMTLRLLAPLGVNEPASPGPAARLKPVADEQALAELVAAEPFQTQAQDPPRPSDITNLLLIGSEEQIRQAFAEAGWSPAAGLNAGTKFETLRALAEDRAYREAPVSLLTLEGKPPDMVFEKLNNTFAKRHHLRIWLRPAKYGGRPVWAAAATHDTGISFSQQNHTFIHRIDPQIDRERAKVVNDLLFTGKVASVELVERPAVPQHSHNATGDAIETDARIAVLVFP
jgi:hypothetical protein